MSVAQSDWQFHAGADVSQFEGEKSDEEHAVFSGHGEVDNVIAHANVGKGAIHVTGKADIHSFGRLQRQHPAFENLSDEDMIKAGLGAPHLKTRTRSS